MTCGCNTQKKYTVELVDVIKHGPETYSFDFRSDEIKHWYEGDSSKVFMTLGDTSVGKKFSYATLPDEKRLRFTTRIREARSDYKDALGQLKIGDQLEISEPSGNFRLRREERPIVILSNGVGIAASRSLIQAFHRDHTDIPEMVQINVDRTGQIYGEELEVLSEDNEYFHSIYLENRELFYPRVDFEMQNLMIATGMVPYIYIVGSNGFVNGCLSHLTDVGFLEEDIITDSHISINGGCGCSSTEGCGCGANLVTDFIPRDQIGLSVLTEAS